MATTAKDIISGIHAKHPQGIHITIQNHNDDNIENKKATVYQYLIGITEGDNEKEFEHYENRIKKSLTDISSHVECLGWIYRNEEIDEMEVVLKELTEYFNVDLDIEKMVREAKLKNPKYYYLIVTIITIK